MPLGKFTPAIDQSKMQAKALTIRDAMADCTLSDAAISLITLRLNTGRSIAQLARGLGIDATAAYVMMRSPQAQHLMAELAHSMLGVAAVDAVSTMQRIMRSKDNALAYRAAETMMERSGLGISQRAAPDGSTKTVFAFAFGAPQAVEHKPHNVAQAPGWDPLKEGQTAEGALKTGARPAGEATSPVILEQPEGLQPTRPARARTVKRS